MKIGIIGGGPLGLEAALYGASAGLDVLLLERGRLAENVRQWSHVGLFTEWGRNRSPLAARLLEEQRCVLPPADTYPSGADLAAYVQRLAALPALRGRLAPQTEVVALTREGCLKSDHWGHPETRSKFPFRMLTRGVGGEKVRHFDAVIDATGVYATPNFLGSGGAPCPGELALAGAIDYHLPDVEGAERARFGNKATLVVGSGHSAASTALAIGSLLEAAPRTALIWAVRRGLSSTGELYWLDPEDQVSGRRKLGDAANRLVQSPRVELRTSTVVESVTRRGGGFAVTLSDGAEIIVDNVVAHTGFRPDPALWRELQVVEHPATGGPETLSQAIMDTNMELGLGLSTGYAERLKPPGPRSKSQLEKSKAGPDLMRLPEPNFFVVGIKSYGRDAGFLMQNGFRQVRDVYQLLTANPDLDLYQGAL